MSKISENLDIINVSHNMLLVKERLVSLRKAENLTQQELADELGITRSLLASWETGARIPDSINILALSQFFNVSAGFLLGISNHKTQTFVSLKD